MKKHFFTLLTIALFTGNCIFGQITMKPGSAYFAATGVSDEGVVCGYSAPRDPYELWFPETGATKEIGGIAPGDGVGGMAKFSTGGKYLSGSDSTSVATPAEWKRTVLDQSYTITNIVVNNAGITISTGYSGRDGDKGIILTNSEKSGFGKRWAKSSIFQGKEPKAIEALSLPVADVTYIGGDGILAKSVSSGGQWRIQPPASPDVKSYQALDFTDAANGVAGVLLKSNSIPSNDTGATDEDYAVYVTSDGAASWTKAEGVTGTPVSITHTDEITYYLVTEAGTVQKSTDKGLTWKNLATGMYNLRRIKFYDRQTGIITAANAVYKTTDGGSSWNPLEIAEGKTDRITWNDVAWQNATNLVLVGSKDVIYTSSDGGDSWTWANQEMSDGNTELFAVAVNSGLIYICGANSTFYKKILSGKQNIICAARYDLEGEKWEPLGFLGGSSNEVTGNGYAISGDGKTVVGNSYVPFDENKLYLPGDFSSGYCHGVAWSEDEGFMDLGSLFPELCKNARCNAASRDGSVIVGYQDNADCIWVSAVWHKDPAGGYFPNEYILLDPEAGTDKGENIMGECSAVSANGQWIGGVDDYYHPEAWIWSEATGVINLGSEGRVYYINDTGDLVIGSTFIWTKDGGSMKLFDYLQKIKKYDLGDLEDIVQQTVSPNGRYVAGRGTTSETVTVRIDLGKPDTIPEEETDKTSVYFNPATDVLNIDLPVEGAQLRLFDTQGRLALGQTVTAKQIVLPTNGLAGGLYFLHVSAKGFKKTCKIQIVH